ncbi:heat shock transcription factor, X-linked-like [Numida meleagris]|uniref:heat shock transcription factor, X-linked-like n=1 Tax=Numida meleagris TaxID=8996 RepID=UPI000B3DF804|nr:heat shock transcription factor, X-linked-like [Numida meleagris]
MAAHATFGQSETEDIEMELSAAETASAADPEELAETSGSTFTDPAGHDQAPAGHAAGTSIREEQDSQMFPEEEETKGLPCSSSEESAGQARVFSSLGFPQKLWVLVESDQVKSIQWGHRGNCIIIQEEMFKVEVLAREAPVRAFGSTSMKSFVRQLNLYGFTKVPWHLERSSIPKFLAEGEVFAAHRKLLLYSNPHFRRDYPQLLEHCKRRVAPKRRDVAAPSPALQEAPNESPQRSSPGAQPMQGVAAGPERSLQAAQPQGTQAAAPMGPPPAKRPKNDTPRAQAGNAHILPGPAAAPAWEQCQALPHSSLPPSSSQMLGATYAPPAHGSLPFLLPTFTPGHPQQELPQPPETPQLQAPWAALPFLGSCFAMAMRVAAMMMPPDWQPQAAPHCPTCTCSQHWADAGHGTAP